MGVTFSGPYLMHMRSSYIAWRGRETLPPTPTNAWDSTLQQLPAVCYCSTTHIAAVPTYAASNLSFELTLRLACSGFHIALQEE